MPLTSASCRTSIDLAGRPAIDLAGMRLEPAALTLHGPAARALLEPRVMQVLVSLLDAGGAVLSRDALLTACWSGMVVGDDALHRAVAGARRALREAGATGLRIETIPRVGYRLVVASEETVPALNESMLLPSTPPRTVDPESAALPTAPARTRRAVIAAGALAVTGAAFATIWQRRSADLPTEARALLTQGQRLLRLATPVSDGEAASHFEQAARLAPHHAPAWGRLALAQQQVSLSVPPGRLKEALASVESSAAQALALDSFQPDALTAMALLVPSFGQWTRVAQALQNVLHREPQHLPALDAMALLLASSGAVTSHYPLRLKTAESDPLHAGYNSRLVYSHWMSGDVAAADRAGERGMQLWPGHFGNWLARFSIFKYTGRAERALAMLDSTDSRPMLPPPLEALLRITAKAQHVGGSARAAAREALLGSLDAGGPLMAVSATLDLAAMGDTALALDVTEAFLLERGPLLTGTAWQPGQTLHYDIRHRFTNHLFLPVSASLRADKRFNVIVHDIGLAAHWAHSGRAPEYHGSGGPAVMRPAPGLARIES